MKKITLYVLQTAICSGPKNKTINLNTTRNEQVKTKSTNQINKEITSNVEKDTKTTNNILVNVPKQVSGYVHGWLKYVNVRGGGILTSDTSHSAVNIIC